MNSSDQTCRPISILLVEDNPGDVLLAKEALTEARLTNEIAVVNDGAKAMAYLTRQDPYRDAPKPDLILLDLNLPVKDGREVLSEVKESPELKDIPIVVMTSSRAEQDILRAYELQAHSYILKPVDFAQFMQVIQSIDDLWLMIVKKVK